MGKIVKYCGACEESFAERFSFCPNCGGGLEAFEMNPLVNETPKVEPPIIDTPKVDSDAKTGNLRKAKTTNLKWETILPAASAESFADKTKQFDSDQVEFTEAPVTARLDEAVPAEISSFDTTDSKITEEIPVENIKNVAETENLQVFEPIKKTKKISVEPQKVKARAAGAIALRDDITFTQIEEKNGATRNLLLLGSMFLVATLTLGGVVMSLFQKELYAADIGNNDLLSAVLVDDVPAEVEEIVKPKDDNKGGGGGGGGKEEQDPVSKGDPPRQTKIQLNPPSSKVPQFDAELKYEMSTVGNRDIKRTNQPIGDKNGQSYKLSDGPGSGGGMGSGKGPGFGSGRGTGNGSGIGSGNGNGNGDGDGDGNGPGGGDSKNNPPPPVPVKPKEPVGPPSPLKILAKPRPNYTDAARTNNVQGVVRLRVTFNANGTIGSITPVSGLGYGLTEAAIAAARGIKFEPAKKGGQPVASTKVVEFNFALY